MEPLYTYNKQKGWVALFNLIELSCGTKVAWECRSPTDGERFRGFFTHRSQTNCVELLKEFEFTDLRTCDADWEADSERQYYVVTPV